MDTLVCTAKHWLFYTSHIFALMFLSKSLMYSQKCSFLKGKVVGIIQKNWRDYVVTFPSREESQPQGRNAQKVLVTPWDYRIPKIRISTQQAEALQVIWQKCFVIPCSYRIVWVLHAVMMFPLAKTWVQIWIKWSLGERFNSCLKAMCSIPVKTTSASGNKAYLSSEFEP